MRNWLVVGSILAALTTILLGLFFGMHALVRWVGIGLLRHVVHAKGISEAAWWIITIGLIVVFAVAVKIFESPTEVRSGDGRGWLSFVGRGKISTAEPSTSVQTAQPPVHAAVPRGTELPAVDGGTASQTGKPAPAQGGMDRAQIARIRPPQLAEPEQGKYTRSEGRILHEPPPKPAPMAAPPAVSAPDQAPGAKKSPHVLHEPPQKRAAAPPQAPTPPAASVPRGAEPTPAASEEERFRPGELTQGLFKGSPPEAPPVASAAEAPRGLEPSPPEPEAWDLIVQEPFQVKPPFPPFPLREERAAETKPPVPPPESPAALEPAEEEPLDLDMPAFLRRREGITQAKPPGPAAETETLPAAPVEEASESSAEQPVDSAAWATQMLFSPPLSPYDSATESKTIDSEDELQRLAQEIDEQEAARTRYLETGKGDAETLDHLNETIGQLLRKADLEMAKSALAGFGQATDAEGEREARETATPAQYVNFNLFDATVSDERLLDLHEGLYAGLKYKLVVSMALSADLRFASGTQQKVERPLVETVVLDVVVALEENLEIIGERWATLEWPESGPSVKNAEFTFRSGPEGIANIKVLIYYQHNLLFCGAIKFTVRSEGDEWPAEARPISWSELDQAKTGRLSLFLKFQDLDREVRRGINISVHRRSPDLFDLVFFLRSSGPVARAYPLSVQLSAREIEGFLVRSRSALRLLTNAIEHPGTDAYSVDKFLDDMSRLGNELWLSVFRGLNGPRLATMIDYELTRPGDIVQVWIDRSALDFVFPWPWLYPEHLIAGKHHEVDIRQFWGYRFVVEQLRQLTEDKRPASVVTGEPLRIAGALHNFPTAGDERKFFAECAVKNSARLAWAEVKPSECRQFLSQSDAHLLYFYCHGHTEQPLDAVGAEMMRTLERLAKTAPEQVAAWVDSLNLEMRRKIRGQSAIAIEKEVLNMADIGRFQSGDPALRPVVFLNMCESSEFYPGASENLVDVFLRRGARGVIGTEVPVLVAFAHEFSRCFFEAFFAAGKGGEGNEIGTVLWQLRRKFLDEGNPLAFAYTYFGDATTRLKPALIESTLPIAIHA